MCGRFNQRTPLTVLAEQFGFELFADHVDSGPRYNVAPTQAVPAVRQIDGKRQLALRCIVDRRFSNDL